MKIQEVSRLLNIPSPTLRYYEERDLISPVPRKGNQRDYSQSHIEQIQFIQCMKHTGMSLADIHHYTQLYLKGDAAANQERIQILEVQKETVNQKMQELQESLDFLDYKIQHIYQEIQEKSHQ